MIKRIIFVVFLILCSYVVQANTGENIENNSSTGQSSFVISNLYNHLNLQKQNIDTLLHQQQEQLIKIKEQTIKSGTTDDYDIIECLKPGWLDRNIPIDTLRKASTDDYITLSNKIQTLDLKQKAGMTGLEADVEMLIMQITNYAETYQKMINQAVQKTLDRFVANQQKIQDYINQNASNIQEIKKNKQRIEKILTTFDKLQKFLYNSRLTYGLVIQEFVNTRATIKQKFLTNFGILLDKEIAKVTKQYYKYMGFKEVVQTEKDLAMLLWGAKYDMWRDVTIGKYVDDRALSVLTSLVETIRSTYYTNQNPKCETMKTIGKKEEEMLLTIQKQLELFTKDTKDIDNTTGEDYVDSYLLRKQFTNLLEGFYKTSSKEDSNSFKNSLKRIKKEFSDKILKDRIELDELNAMNEQFWTVEKVSDQQKIAEEMIPRCKYLAKKTIHIGIKERCERIIQAATKRLQNDQNNDENGQQVEQETNNATQETNNTGSSDMAYQQPGQTNTQVSTSTSFSSQSQTTLSDNDITNKVKEQLDKIITKYPDQKVRRAAMMVLINNINTKLTSGTLSPDDARLYQAFKNALEKEVEKMKNNQ